jgi:hypothetical protein
LKASNECFTDPALVFVGGSELPLVNLSADSANVAPKLW